MELPADRGQGDIDDRVVDDCEENTHAQDGEYCPPPRMHPVSAGWRCPSPQPDPQPAVPARNDQRGHRVQAGHHARPSSRPAPDSGPHREFRDSSETIGASIAGLPVRRTSMWSRALPGTGATLSIVAISLPAHLLRGKQPREPTGTRSTATCRTDSRPPRRPRHLHAHASRRPGERPEHRGLPGPRPAVSGPRRVWPSGRRRHRDVAGSNDDRDRFHQRVV
jgi:hypothetical protein